MKFELCEAGEWYETREFASAADAIAFARGNLGEYDHEATTWVEVGVREVDADDEPVQGGAEEWDTVAIEPSEPPCPAGEHDWEDCSGPYGHGGGVVYTDRCAHCGLLRRTDTWAQDRSTGRQGLTSVEYLPRDEEED